MIEVLSQLSAFYAHWSQAAQLSRLVVQASQDKQLLPALDVPSMLSQAAAVVLNASFSKTLQNQVSSLTPARGPYATSAGKKSWQRKKQQH